MGSQKQVSICQPDMLREDEMPMPWGYHGIYVYIILYCMHTSYYTYLYIYIYISDYVYIYIYISDYMHILYRYISGEIAKGQEARGHCL